MKKYFLKKTIAAVINFFFILMANYILLVNVKGDVMSGLIPLETKIRMREELGLNKGPFEQFIIWLKNLLKGDMGRPYTGAPWDVKYEVSQMFIKTIEILIPAIIVATIICIFFCAILHMKRRSSITQLVIKIICYFGISIPSFLLVKFIIMLVTGEGNLQDYIGKSNYNVISTGSPFKFMEFKVWLIPFIAVTLVAIAHLFRYLDSLLSEVMNSEFIKMAKAKGLKDKTIMYRHAIKYCACPFVTAISLTLVGLMSNQFVIEIVSQRNGLGMGLFNSITRRDYPVTMGILLYITLITLVINMVVDFIYTLLDPRIKLEG